MNQRAFEWSAGTTESGRSLTRHVIWLGFPVLIEQLLLYLVGFSDTLLTGRYLAVEDLAAVTVGSYLLWFLGSLLIVASAGGTALVAREVGASAQVVAARLGQQSLQVGIVVGIGVALLVIPALPVIVQAVELEGRSASSAVTYLSVVLSVAPLMAARTVGIACLRGAGDTRSGMWVMLLVNAINVTMSWLLVVGPGPIPALGVAGIAGGTALAEATGGIVILAILIRGRSGLKLRAEWLRPIPADLRRLLRVSVPAAAESGTNSLCQLWFLRLINSLGDVATAAHGVAIRCEAIAFLTVAAFAVPASTLTGQALGANRSDLAIRAGRTACVLGVLVLSLLGLALYGLADGMFGMFLGGGRTEVARLGVPVLRLIAFAMPIFAVLTVLSAALRGAGDTRVPMLIVLVGYLAVRIPLTYWLTRPASQGGLGYGLYGAWMAMFADLIVRGTMVAWRYWSGRWVHVRV